jgi:hypothetical protein
MNVEKTAYWLVLAAFGFALLDVCPRGALQNLNHALGHTGSTLCRLATNAENAVLASVFVAHPRLGATSLNTAAARELAQRETQQVQAQVEQARNHYYKDQYEDQIEQARNRAEQERDQALAQADAMREQALANAEAIREEALAKAAAVREQSLAQAAFARAQVEMKRAAIEQLKVRVQPHVHLSRAAKRDFSIVSNDLMSNDPCDYSGIAKAVRASIELSNEQ